MIRVLDFTEDENAGLNSIKEHCYNIRIGIQDMQNKEYEEQVKAEALRKVIENLENLEKYKMLLNDLANELILERN